MKGENVEKQEILKRLDDIMSVVRNAMKSYNTLKNCGLLSIKTYEKYDKLFDEFYLEISDIRDKCWLIKEQLEKDGIILDEIKEF